jgi:hypothetical protein
MLSLLDRAIVAAYEQFDTPADQIVTDPEIGQSFAQRVNDLLAEGERYDLPVVNKRLLNLRRRGQEKGGLPRLRRDYDGRNGP